MEADEFVFEDDLYYDVVLDDDVFEDDVLDDNNMLLVQPNGQEQPPARDRMESTLDTAAPSARIRQIRPEPSLERERFDSVYCSAAPTARFRHIRPEPQSTRERMESTLDTATPTARIRQFRPEPPLERERFESVYCSAAPTARVRPNRPEQVVPRERFDTFMPSAWPPSRRPRRPGCAQPLPCRVCESKWEFFGTPAGDCCRFTPSSLCQQILLKLVYQFHATKARNRIASVPLPEDVRSQILLGYDELINWELEHRQLFGALRFEWRQGPSPVCCLLPSIIWQPGTTKIDRIRTAELLLGMSIFTTEHDLKFVIAAARCDSEAKIRSFWTQLSSSSKLKLCNPLAQLAEQQQHGRGTPARNLNLTPFPKPFILLEVPIAQYWGMRFRSEDGNLEGPPLPAAPPVLLHADQDGFPGDAATLKRRTQRCLLTSLYYACATGNMPTLMFILANLPAEEDLIQPPEPPATTCAADRISLQNILDHAFHLAIEHRNRLVAFHIWQHACVATPEARRSLAMSATCAARGIRTYAQEAVDHNVNCGRPLYFAVTAAAVNGYYDLLEQMSNTLSQAERSAVVTLLSEGAILNELAGTGHMEVLRLLCGSDSSGDAVCSDQSSVV